MKKIIVLLAVIIVTSCDSNTYEDIQADAPVEEVEITYDSHVKAIIEANCTNCHAPGGVASFRPLTTYGEVVMAVESHDLINRIQRQNGEPGLMPQTGRMPMDKIDRILEWAAEGLPEN